jgi:hypothetical protein
MTIHPNIKKKKYRVPHESQCVMSGLIHTGLGLSSLIAHVLHSPPPPPANSFVIGPAVINTHLKSLSVDDSVTTDTKSQSHKESRRGGLRERERA